MKQDASIHSNDLKVIGLLAVMFAGLVGLIGILLADADIDASHLHPIRNANAAVVALPPQAKVIALETTATKPVTPEENWAADDSSHGMRPDAAH